MDRPEASRWRNVLGRARSGGRSAVEEAEQRDFQEQPVMPQPRGDVAAGQLPRAFDTGPLEPSYAEPRQTAPQYADPRYTDTRGVDPRGGDPRSADPRGGDPRVGGLLGADPRGLEARGADRADPRYADPRSTYGTPYVPQQRPVGVGGLPGRIEWQQPAASDGNVDQLIAMMRRDLGGPRVFAFANPKGGVHKTTATVLAAATIGSVRGRGTIAWDDNELRGTLGLRAGSARHARTIRHLVADLANVESTSTMELRELLDDYLRHASDGSYDVLAGEESPRFAQHLDPQTVRRVLELLRRTHDVICVDTGNNVESPNWRTVLQMADQLVVTCVPREDAAFTADWMLDLLHDQGMGDLASNAVTLLSCPTPNPSPLLNDLARHFGTRTRAVTVVPYDPILESGSSIEHTALSPATRRAWLAAAGVLLEPFAR